MKKWKKIWNYVRINWETVIGTIENMAQKMHIRNNLNGTGIKIKFQNLYDLGAFVLKKVTVGKMDRQTKIVTNIVSVTASG